MQPSSLVSQYIKEYLLVHLIFDPKELVPVKAYPINPKTGITFQCKGHLTAETPLLNLTEKRPPVNIFTISSARQNFYQTHEFMLVNVEFHPGKLSPFLKTNIGEIPNGNLDASLILGKEIEKVNDRLANAVDYKEIPIILDDYFTEKINRIKYECLFIDNIGRTILDNPSGFRLDNAAKSACMSHRTFEYRFLEKFGVTPKHFARISRFYQAYEQKELFPKLDWLSIAVQNGYADYQHLVKDFKQFAEATPNIFLEHINLNPEKRLSINPDFVGI
ncbi:MAG: helix-turn-helix domain-containing protein [Ginsengibacter sp.]